MMTLALPLNGLDRLQMRNAVEAGILAGTIMRITGQMEFAEAMDAQRLPPGDRHLCVVLGSIAQVLGVPADSLEKMRDMADEDSWRIIRAMRAPWQ